MRASNSWHTFLVFCVLAGAVCAQTNHIETAAELLNNGDTAQAEAEAVVAQAHAEAKRIASEARVRMTEFLQRRTKQAEEKISVAETQAAAEVRAAAAEAATKAAEIVLRGDAQGAFGAELISKGIADLKTMFQ